MKDSLVDAIKDKATSFPQSEDGQKFLKKMSDKMVGVFPNGFANTEDMAVDTPSPFGHIKIDAPPLLGSLDVSLAPGGFASVDAHRPALEVVSSNSTSEVGFLNFAIAGMFKDAGKSLNSKDLPVSVQKGRGVLEDQLFLSAAALEAALDAALRASEKTHKTKGFVVPIPDKVRGSPWCRSHVCTRGHDDTAQHGE